jgi:plastocyanin
MNQSSVYTFALLYSNSTLKDVNKQKLLNNIKKTIQNDKILSESLHLVCIDNDYSRSILKSNSSGVTVDNWPVFVVKRPTGLPEIYDLSDADDIFDEIHQIHEKFLDNRKYLSEESDDEDNSTILWNMNNFKKSRKLNVNVGDSIRFKSTDGKSHTLVENSGNSRINFTKPIDGFDKVIKFNKPGFYCLTSTLYPNMKVDVNVINPFNDEEIKWDVKHFSLTGKPKEIICEYGDKILFTSKDNKLHDISFADKNWEYLSRMIPSQRNMRQVISIERENFKIPGVYHIISSEDSKRFRLILSIQSEDTSSDEDFMKQDYLEKMTRDYDEKGSNSAHHIIRIDKNKLSELYDEEDIFNETPKGTFAQRRLNKYVEDKGDVDESLVEDDVVEEDVVEDDVVEDDVVPCIMENTDSLFEDDIH